MDYDREIITQSAEETAKLGEELADSLEFRALSLELREGEKRKATVICLYGELGSGKTTFAQGFAKGLGIPSRLLSPTFIIVRRYEVPQTENFLYPLDLYRISGAQELAGLGIAEILADSGSFVLIEWAEKLENQLPKHRIDVVLKALDDGRHSIWISFKKP